MDFFAPVSALLSAFGLSSAAGLNAYIPLLTIGLLGRFQYVSVQEPYALLTTTPVLIILGVLTLVDFVADKIPAVDHAAHLVGALVHPIAGAIVFASQNSVLRDIHPPSRSAQASFWRAASTLPAPRCVPSPPRLRQAWRIRSSPLSRTLLL